jgi:hypothetical protein
MDSVLGRSWRFLARSAFGSYLERLSKSAKTKEKRKEKKAIHNTLVNQKHLLRPSDLE